MSHITTALAKLSSGAPWKWKVGDDVGDRGNDGWTTWKSGHPCPCQNCSQGPPAWKTGRRSLPHCPPCPPDDPISQETELILLLHLCQSNQNEMYFLLHLPPPLVAFYACCLLVSILHSCSLWWTKDSWVSEWIVCCDGVEGLNRRITWLNNGWRICFTLRTLSVCYKSATLTAGYLLT